MTPPSKSGGGGVRTLTTGHERINDSGPCPLVGWGTVRLGAASANPGGIWGMQLGDHVSATAWKVALVPGASLGKTPGLQGPLGGVCTVKCTLPWAQPGFSGQA